MQAQRSLWAQSLSAHAARTAIAASSGPWTVNWDAVSPRLDGVDDVLRLTDLRARASLLPFADKGLDAGDFARAATFKRRILTQHVESAFAVIGDVGGLSARRELAPSAGEIERAHLALRDLDSTLQRAQREHGIALPENVEQRLKALAPLRARIAQLRAFNPLRRPEAL